MCVFFCLIPQHEFWLGGYNQFGQIAVITLQYARRHHCRLAEIFRGINQKFASKCLSKHSPLPPTQSHSAIFHGYIFAVYVTSKIILSKCTLSNWIYVVVGLSLCDSAQHVHLYIVCTFHGINRQFRQPANKSMVPMKRMPNVKAINIVMKYESSRFFYFVLHLAPRRMEEAKNALHTPINLSSHCDLVHP